MGIEISFAHVGNMKKNAVKYQAGTSRGRFNV